MMNELCDSVSIQVYWLKLVANYELPWGRICRAHFRGGFKSAYFFPLKSPFG